MKILSDKYWHSWCQFVNTREKYKCVSKDFYNNKKYLRFSVITYREELKIKKRLMYATKGYLRRCENVFFLANVKQIWYLASWMKQREMASVHIWRWTQKHRLTHFPLFVRARFGSPILSFLLNIKFELWAYKFFMAICLRTPLLYWRYYLRYSMLIPQRNIPGNAFGNKIYISFHFYSSNMGTKDL